MRTFMNTRGTHFKWWSIEVVDEAVLCTWGRVGTTGQSKNFLFATPRDAARYARDKIQEKLDKQYVEVL